MVFKTVKVSKVRFYTMVSVLLSFISINLHSQELHPLALRTKRTTLVGLTALGAWSAFNVASGAYGVINNQGENYYFHQMNALWNTVNLGLAVSGLAVAKKKSLIYSEEAALRQNLKMRRIFLINSGVDVIYIGSGLLLRKAAQNSSSRKAQFNGYGNSLLLQGGFLVLFDLVMFAKHKHNLKTTDSQGLTISSNGIKWVF